jgi:hypothetical protein
MENVGIFIAIWNILRPFGIFYGHLGMLWLFGIFFPVLVYCVWQPRLGYILGDFFRNSSGHTGRSPFPKQTNPVKPTKKKN